MELFTDAVCLLNNLQYLIRIWKFSQKTICCYVLRLEYDDTSYTGTHLHVPSSSHNMTVLFMFVNKINCVAFEKDTSTILVFVLPVILHIGKCL